MKIIATLLLLTVSLAVLAAEAFTQNSIVLLQPNFLIEKRADVPSLSAYIKGLNKVASNFADVDPDHTPRTGFIVFAARPDGTTKIWLDLKPELAPELSAKLVQNLEATKPLPKIREGTVVAAINISYWGAQAPIFSMPSPPEWRKAMKDHKGGVEITALVDSIWPQKPGT